MSITLLCLVKGNTTANAFAVDIESDKLVSHLKKVIKAEKQNEFAGVDADKLQLWKVEIPDDQDDHLRNFPLQDNEELLATRDIEDYWTEKPPKRHIHVIVKLPLLSLEEALSCIPPPVTYSPRCVTSKTTTKVNGDPPTKVLLWKSFLDEVNKFQFDQQPKFENPKFVMKEIVIEEDVRVAMDVNICIVLSDLMRPEYKFSRLPTHTTGIPDFTCYHLPDLLLLTIEIKRKHILQEIEDQTLPEFYRKNEKARMVVQQIFNYMGENNLKYGILSTYDHHWFLKREHTKLWISRTLPLQSTSPPVLKTYAYLAQQAQSDTNSPNPLQVPVPAHGDNNSRILRSHSKLLANQLLDQQSSSSNTPTYNAPVDQQYYSFADFKFQSILGEGRSGKTLLCEFRGNTIALKSIDLSKTSQDILEDMKKEVEFYKLLSDIQGKYIPKLVCYGYYGGGMSFVIGMTIVGTPLSSHKLTKQQKIKALKALKKIHDHGILHNDIREENILVDNKGNVFLIDFGMASREDFHKKRNVFNEELRQFSQLLEKYITNVVRITGPFSYSRRCKMGSHK